MKENFKGVLKKESKLSFIKNFKNRIRYIKVMNKEEKKESNQNGFDELKDENNRKINLKINKEKIKESALVISAVVLIGVGYINFSKNTSNSGDVLQTYADSAKSIGDVELVSSEVALVENSEDDTQVEENNSQVVENTNNTEESQVEETISENTNSNNSLNNSYFTEIRMNRDNIYSQSLETYQKIVNSSTIASDQKSIAIQEIEKITKIQNEIAVAEELVKLKGFEDVVIYVNDKSVSVIVRAAALSLEQVAQIQNIISRELGVEVKDINISMENNS